MRGFDDRLDETTFRGQDVAGLSALAPAGSGRLFALSDRSVLFTLDARHDVVAAVPLRDAAGAELDSEGLAADRDGSLWVSSETGPQVLHVAPDGRLLPGAPDVPAALRTAPAGRAPANQSFEGLALSADGRTLTAAGEGALAGDATGVLRFQTWRRDGVGAPFRLGPQLAYAADPGLGVPEVAATPDGRLLVLERGFLDQVGNTVRLYVVDPAAAPDVAAVGELAADAAQIVPKTLLADLVTCPPLGATAEQPQLNPLLDNVEGMVVRSARGERRLRVSLVSDDNQRPTQTTRLYDLDVTLPTTR
nr:esterase-like activity of phytase family protein [Kineococcus siccus]